MHERIMEDRQKTDAQIDRHTEDRAADGKQVEDRSTDIETDGAADGRDRVTKVKAIKVEKRPL